MNNKQIAKRIALTIAWFLLVLFVVTILMGCCTTSKPEFKPLPPEKLENLLFPTELKNIAYKSVTKKDYECKEEC